MQAQGAELNDLKPWNAEQELSKRETPMWEQWGSPAVFVANLLSAFTHQPMTNALNASAAAMESIQKGDMASYNKAFDAWKQNTELVQKRASLEHQMYEEIDHLRERDMATWRAKATAIAARFNDQRGLALLQNGMDPDFLKVKEATAQSIMKMAEMEPKILENHARTAFINSQPGVWTDGKDGNKVANPERFKQAMDEWNNKGDIEKAAIYAAQTESFEKTGHGLGSEELMALDKKQKEARYSYRGAAGAVDKAQERQHVRDEVQKEHTDWSPAKVDLEADRRIKAANASPMTGNEKAKQEAHLGQYDMALDIADQVESTLNRYALAAGAGGKVTRMGERVGNIFGSNETDRVQMMRDIEQLQLMSPRLLLDQSTGRPLSVEAGHISDIIAA